MNIVYFISFASLLVCIELWLLWNNSRTNWNIPSKIEHGLFSLLWWASLFIRQKCLCICHWLIPTLQSKYFPKIPSRLLYKTNYHTHTLDKHLVSLYLGISLNFHLHRAHTHTHKHRKYSPKKKHIITVAILFPKIVMQSLHFIFIEKIRPFYFKSSGE